MKKGVLQFSRLLVILLFGVGTILGSGGGGGGGDGVTLVYTGNTNPTIIGPDNASRLVANQFGIADLSGSLPMAAMTSSADGGVGVLPVLSTLGDSLQNVLKHRDWPTTDNHTAAALVVNQTDTCYDNGIPSGSVTYNGTLNDDATGTLRVVFNHCTEVGVSMNGSVTMTIATADVSGGIPVFTDYTFSMPLLTIESADFSVSMGGSMRFQLDEMTGQETLTLNGVIKDNVSGRMQKVENFRLVSLVDFSSFPYTLSQIISGRFYDAVDGYLDVVTDTPLLTTDYDPYSTDVVYPSSGVMRLIGADGDTLRLTPQSDTLALLELNLDGVAGYEVSGTLPWSVIAVAGSVAGDADGDGMPDSWESLYSFSNDTFADAGQDSDGDSLSNYQEFLIGTSPLSSDSDGDTLPDAWEVQYNLDPTDGNDAAADGDGDGASNLQEYQAGTNPTDPSSAPADLAVTLTDSVDPVSANTRFTYSITLTNAGPSAATGISITNTLPAGVTVLESEFQIIGMLTWDWNLNGDVLLFFPQYPQALPAGQSVTFSVPVVAPLVTGDISNVVSVTATTTDTKAANNSVSESTTVLAPVLSQQQMESDGVAGVDGLDSARGMLLSADGAHLYVAGVTDNAVAVFARDAGSGALSFLEMQQNESGGISGLYFPKALTLSPDGKHLYVACERETATSLDGTVVVFARNASTGALSYVETLVNGNAGISGLVTPMAITTSHDGNNVYVAGSGANTIVVFDRNSGTGALTYAATVQNGVDGVEGISSVFALLPSLDDAQLYAAGQGDNAVAVFSRNTTTGLLTFSEVHKNGVGGVEGLGGVDALAVSPDGVHLYAASAGDNALAIFSRNTGDGTLSYLGMLQAGSGEVEGLGQATAVTVSPNGDYVYAMGANDNALVLFARDASTGALRYIEQLRQDIGGITALNIPQQLVASPNGAQVYVSATGGDSVAVFAVDLAASR